VLDWKDFTPGRSILQQIEGAAERCNAGIFLFTEDDKLPTSAFPNQAAPRDSVVFEAGYFINSKGKDHVLIIQEAGAKTPAELGGEIYGSLEDKSNIATIEETVRKFVKALQSRKMGAPFAFVAKTRSSSGEAHIPDGFVDV
jgi:predicted nucleotide-binding protein